MRRTSKPPRSRLRLSTTCAIALIPLSPSPRPSNRVLRASPGYPARGEGGHFLFSFLHHPGDIRMHVVIPESNHAKSSGFQPASPLCVCLLLIRVLTPIKLND